MLQTETSHLLVVRPEHVVALVVVSHSYDAAGGRAIG
jgi:hypothetical protein